MSKIKIAEKEIAVQTVDNNDYICISDIAKLGDDENRGIDRIKNWLRNKNTIEYLGLWEELNNPNFKVIEFDHFKNQAGSNSFVLGVKQWIEKTNAIGIISKSGRYGGTYAHKDIAFEFAMWISPKFKLLLIKEYQILKEKENEQINGEWSVNRLLSKANYHIHTNAVKDYIIPQSKLPYEKQGIEYANEADMINTIVFGYTAKEWATLSTNLKQQSKNMRDYATINELIILSNLESHNADLIEKGLSRSDRYNELLRIANRQRTSLENNKKEELSNLNQKSKQVLDYKPREE